MYVLKNQTLASTTVDEHGEQLGPEHLQQMKKIGRIPLWDNHRADRPELGYVENLRIRESNGVHYLIGDLHTYAELDVSEGSGLSIGGAAYDHVPEEPELHVLVPYPAYDDSDLNLYLTNVENVAVGRYIKKALDPGSIGLIISVAALVVGPEWSIQYKKRIRPNLKKAIDKVVPAFRKRNCHTDLQQKLYVPPGRTVDLVMIPYSDSGSGGYSISLIDQAVEAAVSLCQESTKNIQQVTMLYDPVTGNYKIYWIQYDDGQEVYEL